MLGDITLCASVAGSAPWTFAPRVPPAFRARGTMLATLTETALPLLQLSPQLLYLFTLRHALSVRGRLQHPRWKTAGALPQRTRAISVMA